MTAISAQLPALQVVLPLLGAVLAALMRRGTPAFALTLAISWTLPFISGALLYQTLTGDPISYRLGGWEPPFGIEYRVDVLNAFVLMLVSSVGAVILPFAHRSVASEIDEDKHAWFYCMYLLCLAGLLGIAITGDAFNAFVFLEISSLATYVLIALGRDRRALLSAFQYLIVGTIGATLYVLGVGLIYLVTGTLNMHDLSTRLVEAYAVYPQPVLAGLAFIVVGVGLKLALFPMHVWLPNAYAYAPSVVSAFLAATATKVAVYLLIRFSFGVFGKAVAFPTLTVTDLIVGLSIAAMFVGAAAAVYQTDLKRMLAYSSVSQIGYITLGVGLANQAGLTGGIVHLANHAIMKAALFLALGAAVYRIGTCKLNDLSGIGRRMPLTMTAFAIAGFGLIGTPGTAGFISKWYLALGSLEVGGWPLLLAIVASSMIAVVYVGRVVEVMWFREESPHVKGASEAPLAMLLPILVLAAATVYFGFDTRATAGIATRAAEMLIGGLR
ncbi:MAG: monovalent cation/H+ antiporter subunit D family protein [Alphaproteobacteria bacterium]|nr:monovalent cation/H+ antiporter subunit D family protein [Alphaproteobacteria bacterium]